MWSVWGLHWSVRRLRSPRCTGAHWSARWEFVCCVLLCWSGSLKCAVFAFLLAKLCAIMVERCLNSFSSDFTFSNQFFFWLCLILLPFFACSVCPSNTLLSHSQDCANWARLASQRSATRPSQCPPLGPAPVLSFRTCSELGWFQLISVNKSMQTDTKPKSFRDEGSDTFSIMVSTRSCFVRSSAARQYHTSISVFLPLASVLQQAHIQRPTLLTLTTNLYKITNGNLWFWHWSN